MRWNRFLCAAFVSAAVSVTPVIAVLSEMETLLSAFVDVDELKAGVSEFFTLVQEANEEQRRVEAGLINTTVESFVPVDNAYPLMAREMQLLLDMHEFCATNRSVAMKTWCTGQGEPDPESLCPPGIQTQPCTGRVLMENRTADDEAVFLWPWQGIRCDALTDPTTITHIHLPDEHLDCRLDDFNMGIIGSLEHLDLSGGALHGPVPTWLGAATSLRVLNLHGNNLSGLAGSVLAEIVELEVIDLGHNQLNAVTMSYFRLLKNLRYLDLSNNKFNLELTPQLFQANDLEFIDLSNNNFNGSLSIIPPMKHIKKINLSYNALSGSVPDTLWHWGRVDPRDPVEDSLLTLLDISNNNLSGSLPPITNFTHLTAFNAANNSFSGLLYSLPPAITDAPDAEALVAGNNFLCPLPYIAAGWAKAQCWCAYPRNATNTAGTAIAIGFIPAKSAASLCPVCPSGTYANASTQFTCAACPAGTIPNIVTPNISAESCRPCSAGSFSSHPASIDCQLCPVGTFASSSGSTECQSCYPGEYNRVPGAATCSSCVPGSFSNQSKASECTLCAPGTFAAFAGQPECLKCPPRQFQDATGATACKPCPVGHVAPLAGSTRCYPCPAGSYHNTTEQQCMECPEQTYTSTSAQLQCSACPPNSINSGRGNTQCYTTPKPGFGWRDGQIVECEPGWFNAGTTKICMPCREGTFVATFGASACQPCARGTFSSTKGATECTAAPPGTFEGDVGAWQSTPCPINHVANGSGAVACEKCPPPSIASHRGATACQWAKPGEVYSDTTWPMATMVLIGTDISDMHLADIERGWTKALLEYSADEFQPHAVNFEALTPTHDRVRIDVAFEAVVEHEPRRPLRWLAKFHKQIMEAKEFLMKMKDKLMNPMAALLGERSASGERASRTNVSQLVMFAPFQDCLRRSLLASNVSVPSPLLMQVSAAGEWRSHRTVMCPPGTAQITAGNGSRVCEPCPLGTFSNKGGQQQCTKCADGWYADQTGLTKCFECDPGEESTEDASGCRHCGWLVPGCPDFWDQVYYQGLIILTLMCSIFPKCREMCGGDRHAQQRSEGVALVAAVRTHGHVCLGRHRRHGGSPAIVSARHLLQELSSIRQSSQV